MAKETIKATVSIKAESLGCLQNALEEIAARAGMTIVADAIMSTSMSIESMDSDDLRNALTDIARAIAISDGVKADIKAPHEVWQGRTAIAGPTPIEQMINRSGLFEES